MLIMVFTVGAWYLASEMTTHRVNERFLYRAEKERDRIVQHMEAHEQVLRGVAAFIESSEEVSHEEWHRYFHELDLEKNLPGVQGLGFALLVAPGEKAALERKIRVERAADYSINPPGTRDQYGAIIYLEPHSQSNLQALGYDMYTDSLRREAMERARDSGLPALSGKVMLAQETSEAEAGFIIYLPVYRGGRAGESVEQRRAALVGHVFSMFRANDLLRDITGGEDDDLDFALFDGSAAPGNLLYDSTAGNEQAVRGHHVAELPIELDGHRWVARFQSRAAFDISASSYLPQTVAGVGLLLGLMIFGILFNNIRHHRHVETIAQRLRESEQSLRSILDNTRTPCSSPVLMAVTSM